MTLSRGGNLPEAFLAELKAGFEPRFVSTEPSDLETYGRDWTRVYEPKPSLICFPASTDEVSRLLKLCSAHRVPVVPSGGRTGLSAGAVAAHGEVVISLERMRALEPVDPVAQTVRVQAGAVTEAVHHHAATHGLTWPVDFASKGSSTVGGNIATNAGGVKVIRYGLTRHWVLGLQVVLASGQVLELGGALEKNQTGLDLRQLFIGSEGTLGVVTGATLKLCRLPREPEVFFFAVADMASVLRLFHAARSQTFTLNAFEFLGLNCLRAVQKHRGLASPFTGEAPYFVLLEVEKPESEEGRARLEAWLASLFEQGVVLDGTLAQSPKEAQSLWSLREGISESLSATQMVYKHDLSVPVARLEAFTSDLVSSLGRTYQGFEVFLFGHIGDGNLHVNIAKPTALSKDDFLARTRGIDAEVFPLVRKHEGSVSAEHGIGLLKKHALAFSRTPEELALFRSVKQALDPQGILNPGKIFD